MIDSLLLENFKAFGQSTEIDLAPITLFFGENSAGKSSILHALNLLKQTQRARETGVALLPRAEDAISDLGSFRELVFDHDWDRSVTLGIGQRVSRGMRRGLQGFLLSSAKWVGMRQTFSQRDASEEVRMSRLHLCSPSFSESLAAFETRSATKKELSEFLRRPYVFVGRLRRPNVRAPRLQVAECTEVSESHTLWNPIFEKWKEHAEEVVEGLRSVRHGTVRGRQHVEPVEHDERSEGPSRHETFDRAIAFYAGSFGIDQFIKRMVDSMRQATLFVSGRTYLFARQPDESVLPELELFSERVPRARPQLPCPNLAWAVISVSNEVEQNLSSLFPMGPFRRPPERWYIFTGTSPEDVGYKGQSLPDLLFRRPSLVDKANEWLRRLDMGYELRVASVGTSASDLFEVRLVDTRRGRPVEVALSDVGFGVSQILPFVVQSLAADNQIISIEQPEVHIHPRLQADLGDLLAEAIKPPYEHQFLVETHSEHLMLRLQRLVRAGQLKNDDVSVIYVKRAEGGSEATRLRLDEDGDFMDDWPGGFFPERRREL